MITPRRWLAALLVGGWLACSGDSSPRTSPEQAGDRLSGILAGDDPLLRAAELGALLAELPPEALPALRDAFRDASVDRGDTELVLFATWWARFDPEGARAWTLRDWSAGHFSVATAVFRTWAGSDPEAAWEEAQGLFHPSERDVASGAVIAGWNDSGTPGLLAHIGRLDGSVQQKAGDALARSKAVKLGAAGALAWVETLDDRALRKFMEPRVAGAAAWLDPAVAAEWAETRIDDGFRTSGLARRVATRWVRSDPEAAMAWLAGLPDGGDRQDGVQEAFRDWLSIDRRAAVAWMEGQDTSRQRWLEPALGLYARGVLARKDPGAALELALQVRDEPTRHTTVVYIAREWLKTDREAAGRWLEQSDLPEDVVRRARMIGNQEVWGRYRERRRAQRALEAASDAAAMEGAAPVAK